MTLCMLRQGPTLTISMAVAINFEIKFYDYSFNQMSVLINVVAMIEMLVLHCIQMSVCGGCLCHSSVTFVRMNIA